MFSFPFLYLLTRRFDISAFRVLMILASTQQLAIDVEEHGPGTSGGLEITSTGFVGIS